MVWCGGDRFVARVKSVRPSSVESYAGARNHLSVGGKNLTAETSDHEVETADDTHTRQSALTHSHKYIRNLTQRRYQEEKDSQMNDASLGKCTHAARAAVTMYFEAQK